jgi:hypothetical protein
MERITEIYVVLEDRPSTLGEMCRHLAENDINIESIGVFHDTAKLHVKNVSKTVKILNKLNYVTELRDVLKVDLENRPGALAEITTLLGNKGINIEYCYGTLSRKGSVASIILDVSDIEKATALLSGK